MLKNRFAIALIIVGAAVGYLVYTASIQTALAVVTVEDLAGSESKQANIRLGARVADSDIKYQTQPSFLLEFNVRGISTGDKKVRVRYLGMMPDTLREGRDVILEGDYNGEYFIARNLLTQCPSKYEPPKPK